MQTIDMSQITPQMLRGMLGSLGDGVILTAADEKIIYLNASAQKILSLADSAADELTGELFGSVCPLVNIRTGEPFASPLAEAMRTRKSAGLARDVGIVTAVGARYLSATCSPMINSAGSVVGCMVILRDITRLRQLELETEEARRRAEAASQTKTQFLANMSHEIRTPINGMNGMIDLTLRTGLTDEQRENLLNAKHCSEDLLRIINDILDFSKLECGRMEIERIDIDLIKLLQRVSAVHSQLARGKGLYFHTPDYATLPHYIVGDPVRIRQILHNLLTNALKFTATGGITLAVAVGSRGGCEVLEFAVADTGIGMSPAEQQKLFQAFSQVDGSITRRFGGTGLGLTIVKELVEAMGGEVSVSSVSGEGSTFSFYLPLERATSESETKPEQGIILNPRRQQKPADDTTAGAKAPIATDDIADLLAYCEQRIGEK